MGAAVILAGCGGGGSDPPTQASVDPQTQVRADPQMQEGLYLGRVFFGFRGRQNGVLVLDNQEGWVTGIANVPKLFGQGTFRFTGPNFAFTADKALVSTDFNTTLSERPMTLSGDETSLTVPDSFGVEFFGVTLTTPTTGYDYSRPARIADVAGAWQLALNATFTIDSAGAIVVTRPDGQCSLTGSLTPRPSGKNVFNMTFAVTGCADAGTYSGVAITYLDDDSFSVPFSTVFTIPTLRLMGMNQSRTKSFVALVQRPSEHP
ncbi:MAG: hypothetical protein JWO88_3870 [Frankiales bacterium]|nr:hypothetical protein [Frankiales bacterium]